MSPSCNAQRATPGTPRSGRHGGRALIEAYYASRTLKALELLTFQDLSCAQLAATLQVHPRTARRLLLRLAADGYIEQSFDSGRRYRATLRLAALGCQLVAHAQLPRVAAAFVADLHAKTGATAHLIIPSYHAVACVVHCDDPPGAQPPEPMLRELLPTHASAAGKILLAHRQPWRDSVLAQPLPPHTDRTITSPVDLELAAARAGVRGYAIDDGEYQPGTLAIAAPVFVDGQVPAALALSIARRDVAPQAVDAMIKHVVSSANALTSALNPRGSAT